MLQYKIASESNIFDHILIIWYNVFASFFILTQFHPSYCTVLKASMITTEDVGEVSSATLFKVLSVVSKFSLRVLIRVQHQRAFKKERRRSYCLYGPGQA